MYGMLDRLVQRDEDFAQLISFIHSHEQSARLRHYTTGNILDQPHHPSVTSSGQPRKSRDSGIPQATRDVNAATETTPRKPKLDKLLRVARGLHYVSIAIISFLLFEVKFATMTTVRL